jgi:hypothetical protein
MRNKSHIRTLILPLPAADRRAVSTFFTNIVHINKFTFPKANLCAVNLVFETPLYSGFNGAALDRGAATLRVDDRSLVRQGLSLIHTKGVFS